MKAKLFRGRVHAVVRSPRPRRTRRAHDLYGDAKEQSRGNGDAEAKRPRLSHPCCSLPADPVAAQHSHQEQIPGGDGKEPHRRPNQQRAPQIPGAVAVYDVCGGHEERHEDQEEAAEPDVRVIHQAGGLARGRLPDILLKGMTESQPRDPGDDIAVRYAVQGSQEANP